MKKLSLALVALAVLVSCGDPNGPAPKNQDDACAVLSQRPGWRSSLEATERQWGVPMSVQMAILWKESSFRAYARPYKEEPGSMGGGGETRSSAYGFPQALNGTWEWYQEETGRWSARRDHFSDATDFVGWYANESKRRSGISLGDAYNQYLAYHQGHGGFNKGSYRSKSWLLQVARQVKNREAQYRSQLPYCR